MRTYYVGMDVHQASIVIAVLNGAGKVVMESIIHTGAETVRGFLKQLRGKVYVTFEEGTQATWLYDLVRPLVTEVLVCDPRRNALLKVGNKSDRIDSRKLAELLRSDLLRSVYHEEMGVRTGAGAQLFDHHKRPRQAELSRWSHDVHLSYASAPLCRYYRGFEGRPYSGQTAD